MSKKIKITEKQLGVITNMINESVVNVRLKSKIFNFLNADYEISSGVKKLGNEFFNTPLIKKKINGEMITPEALCKYLVHKFNGVDKSQIIDSIEGWYRGDFDIETGMRKK